MTAVRLARLRLLLLLLAVVLHAAAAATTDEDRNLATLNTLTTSCNGGCKTNSACVLLGQSSENPINCVSDANCITLLSGKAALCMQPFAADASAWAFAPAKTNAVAGAAPFERAGLVQVTSPVRTVYVAVSFLPSVHSKSPQRLTQSLSPLPTGTLK